MMTPERWQRIREVFEQALETPEGRRAELLDEACGADRELQDEVESLLRFHQRLDDGFLEPRGVGLHVACGEMQPWAESLIGRRIGGYTVVRLLGRGGMGCVFEARQERPARAVALKVLHPGFSAPSALARFRLEPELLGRLQHPNIAQVFEAGVHESAAGLMPYFAMELIADAQPLREYASAREMTTRQRLALFAKICDAVQHGHQKGIIHRDIKPANILVGQDGEPKMIDFGVARASDADIMLTTQCTHAGDLIGTVHYMSPEQCDGDPAAIDTRSDVYSLGVVLYELLTGMAPYDTSGTSIYQAVRVIKDQAPRPPSQVNQRLRGNVEAILLKSLEKDPAQRYGSAADLGQDIRRHLAGEPTEARPVGRWRTLLRWTERRPRAAAIVSAVAFFGVSAVATLLGIRVYLWHYLREPVGVRYDDEPPHRSASFVNRKDIPLRPPWTAGENGTLLAEWIRPYPDDKERGFALVGFHTASVTAPGELQLYDPRYSLQTPAWRWHLEPADLPDVKSEVRETADRFSPQNFWPFFDIFPEAGPPRANEIVCQFGHNTSSARALCIFDIGGQPLYRVWCDGGIYACHWLPGPRLLVLAANYERKRPFDYGCHEADPAAAMLVVFALRPELGAKEPRLVEPSGTGRRGEMAWYKWLGVCPIRGDAGWASWRLSAPPDGDSLSTARLSLLLASPAPCLIEWRIDEYGNRVEGSLVASQYETAYKKNPTLPPIEDFVLQDFPPGSLPIQPSTPPAGDGP